MPADLGERFQSPGSEYRGKPFWSWNGDLEEEELRRQLRVFGQMGLGGGFMHSRVGLATPYLSEEWMDRVGDCIDECRRQGLEAWLYDEDRWPSGAGGGLVTRDETYRMRFLVHDRIPGRRYRKAKDTVAAFAARFDGEALVEYRRLRGQSRPKKGEEALVFRVELSDPSPWFNGYTYLDTMSHAAVNRFIEVTHEAYAERFGDEFGKTVPGIFTDEPNRGPILIPGNRIRAEKQLPWTAELPKTFKERYGYDVRDRLPELCYDIQGFPVRKPRLDYHDCTTFLFVDAFARQIGEWCDAHGLLHTGHVLAEETLRTQSDHVGSAMRFYEHMQAPGIDVLTQFSPEYNTAKQCASVQRQTGRRWMLSELYGCTGWQFPFEGHKAVGDWQAALGVNLRCQHLSFYTMAGQAKRDYPASISFQSPWWKHYPCVEDYFSRVNVLLAEGEAIRDLLVIHPVESSWTRSVVGEEAAQDRRDADASFQRLSSMLLEAHIDFDYGDEEMLSRLGSVRRSEDPPLLRVGRADYRVALVPPMRTIRQSTLDLLERFAKAGGTVVFVGEAPHCVDGEIADTALDLQSREEIATCVFTPRSILPALEGARRLSIRDGDGQSLRSAVYQLREVDEGRALFVCNTDRKKGCPDVRIRLSGRDAEEWDPVDGGRYRAETSPEGGELVIHTDLPASGSRLFLVRDRRVTGLKRRAATTSRQRALKRKKWTVRRDEPNALVLDRPAWRLKEEDWNSPEEILRIDRACREAIGLPPRGGAMVQPWAREARKNHPSARLDLRYALHIDALPEGPVDLALEQPKRYCITVNGTPVSTDADAGWWVDPSLRRVPVDPALLRKGENEIRLGTTFREDSDLEIVYLLGEFGVKLRDDVPRMVPCPRELRIGDWTKQGLPFYSGNLSYVTEVKPKLDRGERLVVETPRFDGACVRVLVDGTPAGIAGWPPYEVDITAAVRDCKAQTVELAIEVVGTRRNSHGPLHHAEPVVAWTGAEQFRTTGDHWNEGYTLVPMGLRTDPVLKTRRPAR
jgi:hypothetical protein